MPRSRLTQSEGGKGVLPPRTPTVGPTHGDLQKGEIVKIISSRPVGRGSREMIQYRIYGDSTLGWAEASSSWGGHAQAIVHRDLDNHVISDILKLPQSVPVNVARTLLPQQGGWDGIFLCALSNHDGDELEDVLGLIETWDPLFAMVSLPVNSNRDQTRFYLHKFAAGNTKQSHLLRMDHSEL